ncbi:MAG: MFS transporter, partial [Rickettsiales bacterium]|nr:MFS transporter [Rickettsiales bacterium]
MPPEHPRFEFWLILTVGLVQFINICDFMMVMPLGPDFAMDLGIPTHQIGLIGGIYTFAAAITGFAGALFLDNFCRKRVLLVTLLGLLFATALAALAWNKESLLAARILAGVFGGPLTSSALALIADCSPPERRGAAIGKVMGAFAAASV